MRFVLAQGPGSAGAPRVRSRPRARARPATNSCAPAHHAAQGVRQRPHGQRGADDRVQRAPRGRLSRAAGLWGTQGSSAARAGLGALRSRTHVTAYAHRAPPRSARRDSPRSQQPPWAAVCISEIARRASRCAIAHCWLELGCPRRFAREPMSPSALRAWLHLVYSELGCAGAASAVATTAGRSSTRRAMASGSDPAGRVRIWDSTQEIWAWRRPYCGRGGARLARRRLGSARAINSILTAQGSGTA